MKTAMGELLQYMCSKHQLAKDPRRTKVLENPSTYLEVCSWKFSCGLYMEDTVPTCPTCRESFSQ